MLSRISKTILTGSYRKQKVQNGYAILTTHRAIWCLEQQAFEIPLCYVSNFDKGVIEILNLSRED